MTANKQQNLKKMTANKRQKLQKMTANVNLTLNFRYRLPITSFYRLPFSMLRHVNCHIFSLR